MTTESGDGLNFDELLQIAKKLNVNKLLSPDLQSELLSGVNSMLLGADKLKTLPLLDLLPGNLGARLDGAVRALQLMKGLLEA